MDSEKQFYNKNNFVLIKNYFNSIESQFIINKADSIEKMKEEKGKSMIYYESEKKKSRIEHFINYDLELKQFIENRVRPTIDFIVDNNMVLFKDKINWKYPGGKGFKAHQDYPAWSDFVPNEFVSIALFANDTTIENGCLEFVFNNDTKTIYNHEMQNGGKLDSNIENNFDWNYVTTTPRDLLIFNSYAFHRSGPNNSQDNRRIFYFTYNSTKFGDLYDKYFERKKIEFPPNIDRDPNKHYDLNTKYNLANPII